MLKAGAIRWRVGFDVVCDQLKDAQVILELLRMTVGPDLSFTILAMTFYGDQYSFLGLSKFYDFGRSLWIS